MRAFLVVVGAIVVLVVAAHAGAKLTVDHRSSTARSRLEQAASRFVGCYKRDRSYLRCRTGTSKLAVSYRGQNAFALTSAVDFGPSYTISRTGTGELKRSCQPSASACPAQGWRPERP